MSLCVEQCRRSRFLYDGSRLAANKILKIERMMMSYQMCSKSWLFASVHVTRVCCGVCMFVCSEFLAATINMGKLEQQENLRKAFEHFDKDGNGQISQSELMQVSSAVHEDLSVLCTPCSPVNHNTRGGRFSLIVVAGEGSCE